MTLYDYPDCPFAKKVRIVLNEKELECDTVLVDLASGEHRSEEFVRLNPFGRVPVLVDEDCVIYESTTIVEYLNDEYPHPPMLPEDDSEGRSRVRILTHYADQAFSMAALSIMAAKAAEEQDDTVIEAGREALRVGLAMLERELQGKEYLCGEYSMADVAFAPIALDLGTYGVEVGDDHPNVKAWTARLLERPSIGSVMKMVA